MSEPKMKASSKNGLIEFEFDHNLLKMIEKELGNLKSESRKVLKNAVNRAARQAKTNLAKKAQETYSVKKTRFTKAMATKNATIAKPEATIKVTGEQMELKDFKVSPATYQSGRNRPSVTKAKVLLSSSLKPLDSRAKAFITRFSNGHITLVQRIPGQTYKTKRGQKARKGKYGKRADMTFLKKLLSNSIPKMVGSQERVYGIVEPDIYDNLMRNIQSEIRRVLNNR